MKCVQQFGTGRHKRQVDIALLFGNRFIICTKLLRPTYQGHWRFGSRWEDIQRGLSSMGMAATLVM